MPVYQTTPFKASPALAMAGTPTYLFGSFDDRSSPTQGPVISDSGSTTTATLTFRVLSGNAPAVGELITVVGTSRDGGNFNVTNATILTATTTDDGISTVTYAKASGTVGVASDAGQVIIPRIELGEALTAVASVPVAMPYNNVTFNQNQALTAVVSFPSLPTSVVVSLQQAVRDIDSEYATIASIATVSGGVVTVGGQVTVDPTLGRFFRFSNGTVVGGSSPTIIAKLLM